VGLGQDIHAFAPPGERPLVIGGVRIPHPRGLAGHSDADVLFHAVGDAILGALGEGDLGQHFPDTDPSYRGIDSAILLGRIADLMCRRGWGVVNVDTVIVAQEPKLAPHVPEMRQRIGSILGIPPEAVGVKATTSERLGFTGRREGIAVTAVVLLHRPDGEQGP
jgi:2-C-methyl-D-erythritol 2,4-cyclodiphosphate synthase